MSTERLSVETLRRLLRYEPETGKLYWRERPGELFASLLAARSWNTKYANKEAGYISGHGHKQVEIFGVAYYVHCVAWAIYFGEWPDRIDHEDGSKTNNRINNLRDVSNSINGRNCSKYSHNTSGHNGISWYKRYNKWIACVRVNGKYQHLGYFDNIEDAVATRLAFDRENGFTERHGK